jgi:NADH-quinone oxidoreductase subunit M
MVELYHTHWVLTFLVFAPMVGAAIALLVPVGQAKWVALVTSVIELIVAIPLFFTFDPAATCMTVSSVLQPRAVHMQNCTATPWIEEWGIYYRLGLDGISLFMVLLTAFLTPLMVLGSWSYIQSRERAFYSMLLVLTTGVMGVFVATDIFLFYVFWEMMLIPMYFLIGIWGGKERIYAAVKFFLYTAAGSLLMLVAILYLYFKFQGLAGTPSFSYFDLLALPLSPREQGWLFAAFALAFAVKVPVFPLHTWLPAAHTQAPTAGSVILAGVLLKMGIYGFLRFALPLFPQAATAHTTVILFMVLGTIGIIYTAMVAAVQPNAKRLVAYTSVAHLGFAMLGIFAFNLQGLQGTLLLMIAHGVSTPMLFFLLGMLYERRHSYELEDFGGLAASMPIFAAFLVFAGMAAVGLPGTSGFVSEFLVLIGTFRSNPWIALVATAGVIFAAYYMLPMVQKIIFNSLDRRENRLAGDLNAREIAILVPLVVAILWLGIFPRPFLDRMEPSVRNLLEEVTTPRSAPEAALLPAGMTVATARTSAPTYR